MKDNYDTYKNSTEEDRKDWSDYDKRLAEEIQGKNDRGEENEN